jgi:hypothetical protein
MTKTGINLSDYSCEGQAVSQQIIYYGVYSQGMGGRIESVSGWIIGKIWWCAQDVPGSKTCTAATSAAFWRYPGTGSILSQTARMDAKIAFIHRTKSP